MKKDMQRTNADFDSGKLRAFGDAQDDVLRQFQRVRQLQVALSLKQVAMLGEEKEHSERDIDDLTRRLADIAAEMERLVAPPPPTASSPAGLLQPTRSKNDVDNANDDNNNDDDDDVDDDDDDDDEDD